MSSHRNPTTDALAAITTCVNVRVGHSLTLSTRVLGLVVALSDPLLEILFVLSYFITS